MKLVVLLIAVFGIAFYAYRHRYPYGRTACGITCVIHALRAYASDHDGKFPPQLATVAGTYLHRSALVGLSGSLGNPSWVYAPNLKESDGVDTVVIAEAVPGIGGVGQRISPSLHVAATIDERIIYITNEEFRMFSNRVALSFQGGGVSTITNR